MRFKETEITQLAPGITLITCTNRPTFPYVNSILFEGSAGGLLIDSSMRPDVTEYFRGRFQKIAYSHCHTDHIRGYPQLADKEIWAPEGEEGGIKDFEAYLELTGLGKVRTSAVPWLERFGHPKKVRVDHTYKGGKIFDLGGLKVEAVALPGHSLNHCGFWCEEHGVLFSADVDLTRFGPWFGFDDGDLDLFLASLDKILVLKPRIVATSHRVNPVTAERLADTVESYKQVIFHREERIFDFLKKKPSKLDNLANQNFIYEAQREPRELFLYWEKNMLLQHMNRLQKQERIVEFQ